jgi:hypothetical protein
MGWRLDIEQHRQAIIERVKSGKLKDAPTGPILTRFDPKALAAAIECEVDRSNVMGWTKLSIHMDVFDAVQLAKFLRRQHATGA